MILIHAHAQRLRNGMVNPKNYPHWPELLRLLGAAEVVQVGVTGDEAFVPDFRTGLPLRDIRALLLACDYWISVDSFLPHMAFHAAKQGVVLWSLSDPRHFGYAVNLNILRDRSLLRRHQFRIWEEQSCLPSAWLDAPAVAAKIGVWRLARSAAGVAVT